MLCQQTQPRVSQRVQFSVLSGSVSTTGLCSTMQAASAREREESDTTQGQEEEALGQSKQIEQKQPDLATVAEDDSGDEHPPHSKLQRAPSPSASHSSTEGIRLEKKSGQPSKQASAFGHADVQARRAFSGKVSDSGDLGRKSSASAYSGMNPTSTRSASRMFSDDPLSTSKKPSGPIGKREILANSILQLDMDHELDTFTADIDCLMDSSDEEEDQMAAKGQKQSSQGDQGKSGPEPSEKREASEQKKSKKGKADEDEEEDDEVSHVSINRDISYYTVGGLPRCVLHCRFSIAL